MLKAQDAYNTYLASLVRPACASYIDEQILSRCAEHRADVYIYFKDLPVNIFADGGPQVVADYYRALDYRVTVCPDIYLHIYWGRDL